MAPMEDKVNSLSLLDPSIRPISGTRAFILPIFRLQKLLRLQLETNRIHDTAKSTSMGAPATESVECSEMPVTKPQLESSFKNTVPQQQRSMTQPQIPSVASSTHAPTDTSETTREPSREPSPQKLEMADLDMDRVGGYQDNPIAQPSSKSSHENPAPSEHQVQSRIPSVASTTLGAEMPRKPSHQKQVRIDLEKDHAGDNQENPVASALSVDHRVHFNAEEINTLTVRKRASVTRSAAVLKQRLSTEVKTVRDVLQEWLFGIHEGPALQDLNTKYQVLWRFESDKAQYGCRSGIVREYRRLVLEENQSEEEAITTLERLRNRGALSTLYTTILAKREKKPAKRQANDASGLETLLKRSKTRSDNNTRLSSGPPVQQAHFPFPIRYVSSVNAIWREWTLGWNGEPSLESLVRIHGKQWVKQQFLGHHNVFYFKNRVVTTIREAVSKGSVGSSAEAIKILDDLRGEQSVGVFVFSQAFKETVQLWNVTAGLNTAFDFAKTSEQGY